MGSSSTAGTTSSTTTAERPRRPGDFKPTGALSIVQNYMAGPEQPDDSDDWRQMSDTIVTFTATKALS